MIAIMNFKIKENLFKSLDLIKGKFLFMTIILLSIFMDKKVQAQDQKIVKVVCFDGVFGAGYVDNGAYINFTGPNINMAIKNSKLILSMLPSLRFKEDNSIIKNSFVTPSLGVGLTFCYKSLAIQLPLYYNSKTATSSGKWNLGAGIGYRFKK